MKQNLHMENGDRSTVLCAEWVTLNPPRPNRRIDRPTITVELWVALALLVALVVGMSAWSYTWESGEDFSDSGVGCIDDCLEIQDEADTTTSKKVN